MSALYFYMQKEKIMSAINVPIWEKYTLSISEASSYFNIGENKLRTIVANNKKAPYILWIGSRPHIKRSLFEKYVNQSLEL